MVVVHLVLCGLVLLLVWIKLQYNFWKNRGLLTPPPDFFLGNMKNVFRQKQTFGEVIKDCYEYLKIRNLKHGGIYFFFMPLYLPISPELIKSILQNDFQHFVDRGIYYNEEDDPISAHLFAIRGLKWKNLRAKLTPTFTSGKMKMMFDNVVKCSDQLIVEMDKQSPQTVNIKDILARFTTDVIGSCAFGLSCNSLMNPNDDFRKYGEQFFKHTATENFIVMLTFLLPSIMKKCGTKAVKQESSDFFFKVVRETVNYREANNIFRKDFMHLLLQLKNLGKLGDDKKIITQNENAGIINFNELAAQAFIFFVAGYETSSAAMSFCMYELASNPEVQERVITEVKHVSSQFNGEITYEAIMNMTYLEQVFNETLRKYPPVTILNRICTKDYRVPNTDVLLEKGTKVIIPTLGLHYDSEYYPEPNKFIPERFSKENKQSRHHFAFLPFGEGPRNCIGLRFGIMQAKVGLAALLKRYRFRLNTKTKAPIKFDPASFTLTSIDGIWLDFTKI